MSDDLVIQRATRAQVKLRLGVMGVSGGGKTATSLLLAKGMVAELGRLGKLPSHLDCHIGVLDTERDSASLYSHLVPFDTIPLAPPYTVERYLKALTMLERAGYSVILMDQITHEWHGEGGILSWVRDIQSKGGNEYTAWKKPTEEHDRFTDRILNCPAHIICTMRSKTAYALEKNDKGKMAPVRIGLQARQRDGMEYEFTTLLDLAAGTNAATCHKDRTDLFKIGEAVPRMGPEWGARMIQWVYSAERIQAAADEPSPEERCVALADAGIRACDRAPNMPDLIKAFDAAQKSVRAFAPTCGGDVAKRELDRLVAAKDLRKASFGAAGGNAQPPGELISATDTVNLETLLGDSGVLPADVKARFGVPRLAALQVSQWDEVVAWVVDEAGKRGIVLRPIAHTPDRQEPQERAPRQVMAEITGRLHKEADAGGLFGGEAPVDSAGIAGMPDDLPWADEGRP